ncbi:hypothetical protein GDO86_002270 [Hymenochirus boettgeri]|uniref:CCHC-type domain-containing protein n=1 Tax=Hymenochirus boettgeri TaxID=247094 RepID=A0A8T2KG77_9PIPI|nr:hypothetical protein GDO86_002270 [Hymenochirus boettgeri]
MDVKDAEVHPKMKSALIKKFKYLDSSSRKHAENEETIEGVIKVVESFRQELCTKIQRAQLLDDVTTNRKCSKRKLICFYCNEAGHMKRDCQKRMMRRSKKVCVKPLYSENPSNETEEKFSAHKAGVLHNGKLYGLLCEVLKALGGVT